MRVTRRKEKRSAPELFSMPMNIPNGVIKILLAQTGVVTAWYVNGGGVGTR